jgi:hypothetical protein
MAKAVQVTASRAAAAISETALGQRAQRSPPPAIGLTAPNVTKTGRVRPR